jgi:hypothetical protein
VKNLLSPAHQILHMISSQGRAKHYFRVPYCNGAFRIIYCGCNRPANVPEGAHVQWEIELLGFEMPKVTDLFHFQMIAMVTLHSAPVQCLSLINSFSIFAEFCSS